MSCQGGSDVEVVGDNKDHSDGWVQLAQLPWPRKGCSRRWRSDASTVRDSIQFRPSGDRREMPAAGPCYSKHGVYNNLFKPLLHEPKYLSSPVSPTAIVPEPDLLVNDGRVEELSVVAVAAAASFL